MPGSLIGCGGGEGYRMSMYVPFKKQVWVSANENFVQNFYLKCYFQNLLNSIYV